MRFFRHRHRHPGGMSLLAFQDIITALAGAILIIVLASMYCRNQNSSSALTGAENRDLTRQFEQLQQQLTLTRSQLNETQQQLRELREHQQTARQQQTALKQTELLQHQTAIMLQTVNQRTGELHALQRSVEQLNQQITSANVQQQKYLQLQLKRLDLQKKLEDLRLRRQIAADQNGRTVLLDCRRGRWIWSSRNGEQHLLGSADVSPGTAWRELQELLKHLPQPNSQLIIAVRPSAGGFAEALKKSLHRKFPHLKIILEPMFSEKSGGLQL